MTYYTGSVAAVPTANKQKYVDHAAGAWPIFERLGAVRMVETWGEDVQPGKQTDFLKGVQAQDDETVVFSWIEWPDRATADKAWQEMMSNEEISKAFGDMPFDGKRMIFGGFSPIFAEGTDRGAGWYQGFVTPVPEGNSKPYAALARQAHEEMFAPNGCIGSFENWGEDVPKGKVTDMYRTVDARDGEVVAFSWTAWPDRATCDTASRKMEEDMKDQPMPDMPFDASRMIWAGFAPIFDSVRA